MKLYHIVTLFSVLLSVLIAVFYSRTKFRYFFSLLALIDVAGAILWYVFSISAQALWIPLIYLLIFSIEKDFFLRWKYLILSGLLLVTILNYFSSNTMQHYFALSANIIIQIIFLKYLVKYFITIDKLNLFYLVMIFNEAIIIIRFIAMINDVEYGVNVFYLGILIQFFTGLALILLHKSSFVPLK